METTLIKKDKEPHDKTKSFISKFQQKSKTKAITKTKLGM